MEKIKIYSEPCYDLDELSNYNLHAHTIYSACAKREMTAAAIIGESERRGVKLLAFTDHFCDDKRPLLSDNETLWREVEATGTKMNVLYGAELSAFGVGKYTDTDEENAGLDYRLYACNHYHLDCWEHPDDRSPRGYAIHSLEVAAFIIRSGRADALAHPMLARFIDCEDKNQVTDSISDNELGDILALARDFEVAWEISRNAVLAFPRFSKRFWDIGREVGVTFHFACDSHSLESLDPKRNLDELKKILYT